MALRRLKLGLTPEGAVAIETLSIGDRVVTDKATEKGADGSAVDPTTWRVYRFSLVDDTTGVTTIADILRPLGWFGKLSVGEAVPLSFDDIGLKGMSTLLSVSSCPKIATGPGRVVLMTMHHAAGNILDLTLSGGGAAIGVTATHKIYSEDRGAFVPAILLDKGERVRTQGGWSTVESVNRHRAVEEVYNLEVETDHVYYVSALRVLVHNGCTTLPDDALVVRGGTNTPEQWAGGRGVAVDPATGKMAGASVESAPGLTASELGSNVPHKKIGVSTVGEVRAAGGQVVPSPGVSPNHATLSGLTPETASQLFRPTILNPTPLKR